MQKHRKKETSYGTLAKEMKREFHYRFFLLKVKHPEYQMKFGAFV